MIELQSKHRHIPVRRLISFACALVLLICIIPSFSASDAHDHSVVRVGYYEQEVFQEGASDDAVKSGYSYEYYRKISEYTGWEYEYVYGDFVDLYDMLVNGEIDLLAGLALKEDRVGIIAFPDEPMGNESLNLIKHNTDDDITADPATLNGHTIGVLNSNLADELYKFINTHNVQPEVKIYNDYNSLFTDFDSGKLDLMATESDGTYSRKHAEVLYTFATSDYYLCVNINHPDLVKELNTAQHTLSVEEPYFISELKNKYYPVTASATAYTEAEREWLNTHDSLCVGYLDDYLPYSDTDSSGNVNGSVKDLVPMLLEAVKVTDLEVSYKGFSNFDDMIDAVNEGTVDLAFPVSGGLYYSEQNGINQSGTVISAMSNLIYNGEYTDDTPTHFALNENNRLQYYYTVSYFPNAEITYYSSIYECLDAVKSGLATCTVVNGMRADDILNNRRYSSLSSRRLNRADAHCFGVDIGNDGLLKLVNRGIKLVGTDTAKDIAYKYSSLLYEETFLDKLGNSMPLIGVGIVIIAVIIIFFLSNDSRRKKHEIAVTESARQELEAKNAELAESQEALSHALIAAEHANNAKTAFLNNMSHDIRTPMNAIVGFTAMAATHIDNKEQVQDYLSKISVSSRHLLSLINDVLDMSRIESGNMKIEEAEVHLPDVIHDLRTILQNSVKSKQQEFFIDTQDVRNENIITDKVRLSQVLLNILTNAVKFTPPGGTISFRVIEKPALSEGLTTFEFHVKDNGIGMSEEFQSTIFEAFTRERTSTVSKIQGTGLGMAITKNIVDLMGGTITVTSAVGKGSEFTVTMPFRISGNSLKYEPVPELQGLRALVADDDTNTCLSVCSMLRDIGMRPDWTNYGKEAVIRAKEAYDQGDKFKVYIIDWMMPDMNGIETVRRIRKVIGDADPIIVLTAYDWTDIEAEAREAGVTAFCSKPLFMSELRSVLSRPFGLSQEEQVEEDAAPDFTGKRLLLAEDNELNQMIAVSILEGVGFTVDVANDGAEALEKVETSDAGTYEAVLMDIQMPVMDGYEAARRIRALDDPDKADIPIIAVTANAFEEDRKTAIDAGMDGHLAKPYDIPKMLETLQALFKKKDNNN